MVEKDPRLDTLSVSKDNTKNGITNNIVENKENAVSKDTKESFINRMKQDTKDIQKNFAISPSDRPSQPNPIDIESEAKRLEFKNAKGLLNKASVINKMLIKSDKDGIQSTGSLSEQGSLSDLQNSSRKQVELQKAITEKRLHGWDPPKALWRPPSEIDIKAVDHVIRRRNIEYYRTTQWLFLSVILASSSLYFYDLYKTRRDMTSIDELILENTQLNNQIDLLEKKINTLENKLNFNNNNNNNNNSKSNIFSYIKFW